MARSTFTLSFTISDAKSISCSVVKRLMTQDYPMPNLMEV